MKKIMLRKLCAFCLCAYVPFRRAFCLCAYVPFRRAFVPSSKSGFSLLEVLVATTIMVIIVLMVTNMFRNASEAWDTGSQSAEMNTAARAAIEYISRELSCAMAGSIPDSAGSMISLRPFTLTNNDLRFTALSKDDGALRGVMFKLDGNSLMTYHNNNTPYSASAWNWESAKLLITNVWRFEVNVYTNENNLEIGRDAYSSSLMGNSLPACVDIAIEMLGERDMVRALSPGLPDPAGFVMTNSRVYTTRVYFPNRGGR